MALEQLEHAVHLLGRASEALRLAANLTMRPSDEHSFNIRGLAIQVESAQNAARGWAHSVTRIAAEKDDLAKSVDLCREAIEKLSKPADPDQP